VYRHSVLFRFSPETTDEQIRQLTEGLSALPAQIPEILDYRIGPNVGEPIDNWHYAIVADFADAAAWRTYTDHPVHQAAIRSYVHPIVADRAAVQYEVFTS
jgi:hypothetical protein